LLNKEKKMKRRIAFLMMLLFVFMISFGVQPSLSQDPSPMIRVGKGTPQYRAISGVSMGGYGAMNIGLSHADTFKTMACLGGPLDMTYLLKHIEINLLGNYDNPSVYPNRDTLIDMLQDLSISFGNPVYYSPQSSYFPPGITSENARKPTTLLNFKDREDNPDGSLPVITYEDPSPGDWVEVLLAVDLNQNGKRDPGEPVIRQFHEPFTDLNGNGMHDPAEPFLDLGLDGVSGTGDFGEGDGKYSSNPHHLNYMAQDPLTHVETLDLSILQGLNLYLDAGNEDEFQFDIHTDNFADALIDRGLNVQIENGFPDSFPRISHFNQKRVYVKYEGGHVGFNKENIGLNFKQARKGAQGAILVANRFTTLFAFVSDHLPGGEYGTDPIEMFRHPSKMGVTFFYSPSLKRRMRFGIYLPPGYKGSQSTYYPVLYLLGGYNMSISSLANSWVRAALDTLILTGEMQKMIIVIPDGMNYKNGRGHFFVNQIDQERGDHFMDYLFDLIQYIDDHLQTK
jgi:enterochelin esterase-like enzyme